MEFAYQIRPTNYFHKIDLEIGKHKIECYAGFSYDTAYKGGLLGQNGFFDLFAVIFDLDKRIIKLDIKHG